MTALAPARCPRCNGPFTRDNEAGACLYCGYVCYSVSGAYLDPALAEPKRKPGLPPLSAYQVAVLHALEGRGWALTRDVTREVGRESAGTLESLLVRRLVERRPYSKTTYEWRRTEAV
jgi:hypothetical protein